MTTSTKVPWTLRAGMAAAARTLVAAGACPVVAEAPTQEAEDPGAR